MIWTTIFLEWFDPFFYADKIVTWNEGTQGGSFFSVGFYYLGFRAWIKKLESNRPRMIWNLFLEPCLWKDSCDKVAKRVIDFNYDLLLMRWSNASSIVFYSWNFSFGLVYLTWYKISFHVTYSHLSYDGNMKRQNQKIYGSKNCLEETVCAVFVLMWRGHVAK